MNRPRNKTGSNTHHERLHSAQSLSHIADCLRPEVTNTFYHTKGTSSCTDLSTSSRIHQGAMIASESERSRFKLWPSSRSTTPVEAIQADLKIQALAVGRSPTSLSDTVISNHGTANPPSRGGSLLKRRNISVPELTGKVEPTAKVIYTASFADSPTIPGRPPLRKASSEMPGHERSASAPGAWRESPFGGAILSAVGGPILHSAPQPVRRPLADQANNFHAQRLLSPILSPVDTRTPMTAIPRSPSRSSSRSPCRSPGVPMSTLARSPALVSPEFQPEDILPEVPPPVPPKNSPGDLPAIVKRTQSTKSQLRPDVYKPPLVDVPPLPPLAVEPPKRAAPTAPTNVSPTSKSDRKKPSHKRTATPEISVMDRPRPTKPNLRKQNSAPTLPKLVAEGTKSTVEAVILSENVVEPASPEECLPMGLKPIEAVMVLPKAEKDTIHKQAVLQAEQFEVLGTKLVAQLSRELRALEERCEYLRKTYKSLREGRQKLHTRMIAYLKSDTLSFSKDRLLQQQEALIELDASIDDWIAKLERAENRRLRLRQKLLEHVAASMTLSDRTTITHAQQRELDTPPRSPQRVKSPEPLKPTIGRKDVESIKIYADSLTLFNDIEAAVTQMCEAC